MNSLVFFCLGWWSLASDDEQRDETGMDRKWSLLLSFIWHYNTAATLVSVMNNFDVSQKINEINPLNSLNEYYPLFLVCVCVN